MSARVVLALGGSWAVDDEDPAVWDHLRSELRGMGARLVILSSLGAWLLRADDPIERRRSDHGELEGQLERAATLCGHHPDADGAYPFAVFVLDEDRVIFSQRPRRDLPPAMALSLGLSSAGRALARSETATLTLSRRQLMTTGLAIGSVWTVGLGCRRESSSAPTDASTSAPDLDSLDVVLRVNGTDRRVRIDARTSLLDALRERMGLPGTKKGCDHGQCGACTVLEDDRRVLSCLVLAVMAQGHAITTIEGLAQGDRLHPMQEAFIAADGLQCGYCTPGQILSAVGLLKEGHAETDAEVREGMSGNLCRCGAYTNIVAAVRLARGKEA